jgi:hypothetical protein
LRNDFIALRARRRRDSLPGKEPVDHRMARYIIAIVLLACIAGPVFAQGRNNPLAAEDERKRKDAAEVEKQYNAARKKVDTAETPTRVDPWQNMRGADDSKTKR